MRLEYSHLLRDLDRTFAIAGVLFALILIAYVGKIGKVGYFLTGVLALISCLLWLRIRKSHTFEFDLPESRTLTAFWSICFFGLFTLSILSVHFRPELYERPLLYFILTAFMVGTVACEVFTSGKPYACLILIQIMLIGVSVAWSQLLIFPGFLGGDPWYHSSLTNRIVDEGLIPEGYSYSKLPLFHLMIAATSLLAGLTYKLAAMVSVSLGQIICNALFVFLIAGHVFRNCRIGLLAALMVIIANYHINMSYESIPNSIAAVFILISLYLLFFKFGDRSHVPFVVLNFIALAAIILTHTISAMCMALLLFVIWGAFAIYRVCHSQADNHISLKQPVYFIVAMFAWWTYASGTIATLSRLIEWGFTIDFFTNTPKELRGYLSYSPLGEQLFLIMGLYLFFAFSLIGFFYMISRRSDISSFSMAWAGIVPLAISFFSVIIGRFVVEQRWWYFSQILLSIPLAAAIYIVATWKTKRSIHLYCFVFGFVVLLSILMIMSPVANVDSPLFSQDSCVRYSLTESELESFKMLAERWDGPIKTDAYLAGSQKFQFPQVSAFCQQIYSDSFLSLRDHIVVIREIIIGKPFKLFGDIYKLDYDLNTKLDELGFSRIYNSNSLSGYQLFRNGSMLPSEVSDYRITL